MFYFTCMLLIGGDDDDVVMTSSSSGVLAVDVGGWCINYYKRCFSVCVTFKLGSNSRLY